MELSCKQKLSTEDILWVLTRTNICHLGMAEENRPYVIPMFYTYCVTDLQVTFHLISHCQGLKMRCLCNNPFVCIQITIPVKGGYASVNACGLATTHCVGVDDHYNRRDEIDICTTDLSGIFYPVC
ncbi:pyridoxamine 5'-phosphate oxidase family protein [Anaerosporobacter faecicola]|uniref:pyridoxamine 5'-phosphate oxidase family protein n=1 Tax=Anaerosporobacter faecicola TaxID=2718714 RepID=UPI00143C7357|nr:pyridoxamine 5'-phosphate oxidase family protein [Anaerosporobacter faecicola]